MMVNDGQTMKGFTRRSVIAAGLVLAWPAWAGLFNPSAEQQERFLDLLQTPGHALLLRHALAPGHGDPADFDLAQCQTQRNLDAEGRAQAAQIGGWLRERDVAPRAVYSSLWCRCLDSARLMEIGPVIPEPALNQLSDESGTHAENVARMSRFLAEQSSKGGAPIFVTHSSNAAVLIGGMLGSGEGAVIKLRPDGSAELVGRLLFGMERK